MSRRSVQAGSLRDYYAACAAGAGMGPPGVDWADNHTQQARFGVLLEVLEEPLPRRATLLDVGCGFGDLLTTITSRGLAIAYTGCELSPPHVAEARRRHPDAEFLEGDAAALLWGAARQGRGWDYVVASGTFNVRLPAWERWTWHLVEAMWRVTRRTMAFNLLTNRVAHPPAVMAVEPAAWHARCRTLVPAARRREDYLDGDVTYYLPRGDAAR
ncbi:MAG: class I SAM-dependent methyltransferase [Chloroflexota bacterium]